MDNLTVAQQAQASTSKKDEILPVFRIGQCVRLKRDIRNDGTYAFAPIGTVLATAGEEGYVKHVGDFLQTIRVYDVDFIERGMVFGCREEELEAVDDGYDEVADELEWLRKHREEKAKKTKEE